jgi:hypothetical protein
MLDQPPTTADNYARGRIPRDHDDKSRDDVRTVPRNRDCGDHMSSLVAEIEE